MGSLLLLKLHDGFDHPDRIRRCSSDDAWMEPALSSVHGSSRDARARTHTCSSGRSQMDKSVLFPIVEPFRIQVLPIPVHKEVDGSNEGTKVQLR